LRSVFECLVMNVSNQTGAVSKTKKKVLVSFCITKQVA